MCEKYPTLIPPSATRGFTLIEVLIVVLLISILMAMVVGSFTGADREQELRGYAERLALRIELARDKALQANREWGIYIDDEGARFAIFDEVNGTWMPQSGRHFIPEAFSRYVEFDVEVEAYEAELFTAPDDDFGGGLDFAPGLSSAADDAGEEEPPTIVLFSSGETTPFTILLSPREWRTNPWQLSSDGFSRTEVQRADQS